MFTDLRNAAFVAIGIFVATINCPSLAATTTTTTFRTSGGIAVMKTVTTGVAASPKVKASGPKTQDWDDCGLQPDSLSCGGGDSYTSWSFEFSYGDFYASAQLERVEVSGESICTLLMRSSISIAGCSVGPDFFDIPEFSSLSAEGKEYLGGAVNELLADGQEKVLPTCVRTTTPNVDSDAGYAGAQEAFERYYSGNMSAVKLGDKVDVFYWNGDVIRFELSYSLFRGLYVSLPRMVGFQQPSPCKQNG